MTGVFVGLTTLDLIYRAADPPQRNQKLVATDYTVAAGGPATNAAIAFAYCGHPATVVSSVGCHPITALIRADLGAVGADDDPGGDGDAPRGVTLYDLTPHHPDPPPVSSIVVTEATGERAVISINAVRRKIAAIASPIELLQDATLLLIDGHQLAVSERLARLAKGRGIPIVIDAGSWKPGLETVLPWADYVIASANFHPPDCPTQATTIAYLQSLGVPHIAITHGAAPIHYCDREVHGDLPVPAVPVVDTLGAGDIFHGAFCYFILQNNFVEALAQAAVVAARSCQFFGTRRWMSAAVPPSP